MAAITWRNVDAPSFGDSARTLGMAGDSFNNMFGVLNKQLEKHQALGEQNWQNQANNNTDAFMGEMRRRYTTPEAYAAAQASGEVDALRGQYQAQINAPAARELMYKMPENLQRQALTNQAFADNQLTEKFKGTIGEALNLTMAGNAAGGRKLLADSGMPAHLAAKANADLLSAEQQATLFGQKTSLHNAQIASYTSEANLRNAQALEAAGGKPRNGADIERAIKLQSEPYEAAVKGSLFSGPSVLDPKEQANIATLVTSTGTQWWGTKPEVFAGHVVESLQKDGTVNGAGQIEYKIGDRTLKVPLPASLLTTAIQQDNEFMSSPGTGSTAARLRELIKSPDFIDQAIAYENNRLNLAKINQEGSLAMSGGTPVRQAGYDDADPSGFAAKMREYRTRQADTPKPKNNELVSVGDVEYDIMGNPTGVAMGSKKK